MKSIKIVTYSLVALLAFGTLQAQAKSAQSNLFMGGGLLLGGYGNVGAEFMGGYQYYFPSEYNIDGRFRQGVRGYGSIGFSYGGNVGFLPIIVGADYTLDFTPGERFVWGIHAGLGLGFMPMFAGISGVDFAWNARIGGNLTFEKKHRVEVSLGAMTSFVGIRYLYLF